MNLTVIAEEPPPSPPPTPLSPSPPPQRSPSSHSSSASSPSPQISRAEAAALALKGSEAGNAREGASVSIRCHRLRAAVSAVYYTAALVALATSIVLLVCGFRSGSRAALTVGTLLLFAAFGLCTNRCCLGQLLGAPPNAVVAVKQSLASNSPSEKHRQPTAQEPESSSSTVASMARRSFRLAAATAVVASASPSPASPEAPSASSPTSSPPLTPRRATLGVNGLLLGGRRCSAFGLGPGDPAARLSLMRHRSSSGSSGAASASAGPGACGVSGGRRMSSALHLAVSADEMAVDAAAGCWMPPGGLGDFVEFA